MNKFLVSGAIVIVTAVLVGSGTYYYVNRKATNDKNSLNTKITTLQNQVGSLSKQVTELSTPVASPSPTASWQTYTSSLAGISFKYPQNYLVQNITQGTVQKLVISNHPISSVSVGNVPSDFIDVAITYGAVSPTPKELESSLISQLPAAKKQTLATADGSTVTYYVYYSNQASDYSTTDSSTRLEQILAYFTLANGKTFTAQIGNYDWTPKAVEQNQVNFIIQLLQTVKSD